MILSAVNCNSFGIIIFLPEAAIFRPLSSTNPAMSINDCSSEVSLRSAAVARTFEKVPPVANGCEALINDTPSPPVTVVTCAIVQYVSSFNLLRV